MTAATNTTGRMGGKMGGFIAVVIVVGRLVGGRGKKLAGNLVLEFLNNDIDTPTFIR